MRPRLVDEHVGGLLREVPALDEGVAHAEVAQGPRLVGHLVEGGRTFALEEDGGLGEVRGDELRDGAEVATMTGSRTVQGSSGRYSLSHVWRRRERSSGLGAPVFIFTRSLVAFPSRIAGNEGYSRLRARMRLPL
ncbi:hypothetical protein HMPREF9241_00511 [Schaalia turicensis ACS-279-V-Col4]|uniref:Uncharacterized protein n=1 Tax=Schaalia turicensis ACS-279-V-Col4 TaxID=883077 RepID=K0YSR0_9ACTO|nr:hypothetical protein HMPREF9241_00511 [Schaalia turicensis ACS-279-V-Col4]